MPRFYVPQPQMKDGILRIEGREVKHIRRVLRLKPGDEIITFNGSGKEYYGTIIEDGPTFVLIKIEDLLFPEKESPLKMTLAQSLLKGEKMDYVVQKSTELGVSKIIPFFSSRSVPLLEKSPKLKRHHRWERIAMEASKQCGRTMVPIVEPIQSYSEMIRKASPESIRLILWEREGYNLKEMIERPIEKRSIFFVIGPEGGFSKEEIEEAKGSGFLPVNLGKRILRAETASLCLLSILQYELGDIGKNRADSIKESAPTRKEG